MKKLLIPALVLISTFAFIIKPKAIASAYSSLNGKFFETGSWITVKSGSEYTINFAAYNGVNGNAGLIYVRYNYCVFDFNSFTIDREEITVTKTNQSCKFSNGTGNAHVYSVDVKFLFSASDKTLTYGATFHPYREGGVGNLSIELLDYYELDPSQLTIDKNQQETNEKLDNINNSITDETPPNTSEFGNVAGWLPAGPVDSIITLPLNVLNSISNALNGKCSTINLPLPFIDSTLPLTCGTEFYSQVSGLSLFLNTLFTILGGITLYKYFIYLYNWIDKIVSLKEQDEKWGAV